MIKLYLLMIIASIPFTYVYNSTIIDLYNECIYNDCIKIPELHLNKVDSDKPMDAILISVIILFTTSIFFAKHLSR